MVILAQQFLPTSASDWLEIIALIVTWTLALSALYWAGRRRADRMDGDINGLGDRVKELELGAERRNTRLNTVESLLSNQDRDIRDSQGDIQRMNAMIENFRTEQHEMKEEIIGFMSQRTHEITTSVHDLDKRVAVMQSHIERLTKDNERRDGR